MTEKSEQCRDGHDADISTYSISGPTDYDLPDFGKFPFLGGLSRDCDEYDIAVMHNNFVKHQYTVFRKVKKTTLYKALL